ncbi:MAG: transaldolase family protein [Thermomicrobiales bacterium]
MTNKNPLQHLADFGQSVWNDNLSRQMIESGELQDLIDNDGIVGITSNPTIFDTAISKSNDYEEQMRELVWEGRSAGEIQNALMIKDIQDACDILMPVYKATEGATASYRSRCRRYSLMIPRRRFRRHGGCTGESTGQT